VGRRLPQRGQSVSGLADVIEAPRAAKHQYLDYQGAELPW
jgi:hypothetical protein